MKKSLAVLFAALFMVVGVIGCGDDPATPDDGGVINLSFQLKTGDKYTYDYYDRDEQNARVDDSKKVVVWTVLRTDVTLEGKSGAAEIQQITYEADGTTAIDTTTIYLLTNGQGQVLQYNLLQTVLAQFSGSVDLSPVIAQLPNAWIQVSDTKSPSPISWSFPDILQTVQDVDLAGLATLDISLLMSVKSSHKGRMSVTVPAGTYATAYVTDHETPTTIKAAEDKDIPPVINIKSGDELIQDAATLHYAVDIEAGILSMSMDSKSTTLIPVSLPYPVTGFEMELTSSVRAE